MGTGFVPSEEELELVAQIYDRAGVSRGGVVDGETGAGVFRACTDLPPIVLSQVWDIADKEKVGYLSETGVAVALRLIGWAQSGEEPCAGLVNKSGPLPQIKGVTQAENAPISPIATPKLPPFTDDDRDAFQKVFQACGPTYGLLEGDAARDAFMTFGLSSTDDLWKIWEIADTRKRGALDRHDFALGMYLIQALRSGHLTCVPKAIPEGIYESIVGSFQSYVSTPSSPVSRKPSKPKKPVRKPPSAPVSGAPIPSPVPPSELSPPPTREVAGDDAWAVAPAEKAIADQHFDTLDTQNRGSVDEDVAAQFMLGFELTPEDLAYIWDLADLNKDNRLTRDGFAIALHLIQQRLAGAELPRKLPPSLIPPALRTRPPDTQTQRKRASTVGPPKTARAEVRRSLSAAPIPPKPPEPRLSTKPSLRPVSSYTPSQHRSSDPSASKSPSEKGPPLPTKPPVPNISRKPSLRPASSNADFGRGSSPSTSKSPFDEVTLVPVTPSLRVTSKPSLRPRSSYTPSERESYASSPLKTPPDDAPPLPTKPSSELTSLPPSRTQCSATILEHETSPSSSPKIREIRPRLNAPPLPAKPPSPYTGDTNSPPTAISPALAITKPHRRRLSTSERPTVDTERLRNLEQEKLALTSKIEELTAQVDAQRGVAGANARLTQDNKALVAKMQEMEQITSQLLQANEAVHPMAEDLTRENQELMRRIADLEQVQARLEGTTRRLDSAVQENKDLSARLREVREAAEAAQQRAVEEADGLRRTIEQLEEENEELRKRAQDMARTISRSQPPNAGTNAHELEILMADVTRENEGLKFRLRQMQRSTTTLLLSTSNGHAEHDDLRRENQRLAAQVQELEQLTKQLQTSSEDNELQRVLKDVTHENEALKSSLRQVRQQVAHLQSSTQGQLEPLRREIVDLKAEIRRLQRELHTSASSQSREDLSIPPPAYEEVLEPPYALLVLILGTENYDSQPQEKYKSIVVDGIPCLVDVFEMQVEPKAKGRPSSWSSLIISGNTAIQACILMYSVTSRSSFESITASWR
ncbi:putative eps15 homology domain containing protein [Lyophyllum shimeji]|uniref:Eps15 homology domain containing protein n=1 Tax=Lyophyllum shimeji TaxID=47721 RepID=A0A9P3PUU1_LYOSH|nr:putative eps15 homology domain containing protein [Lyophyllum shimeji]